MNKILFAYTNEFDIPRFWDKFNWELYIKVVKAKMKQIYIEKEYELNKLKNETK